MAWGLPQQTEKPQKSISSPYAREIQHLTLKDLDTYLIPDGCTRLSLIFFLSRLLSNLLSTTVNKESMLYDIVLVLL